MKRLVPISFVLSLLLAACFLFSSCEKGSGDYKLTIEVTINDTVRVQNANVHVYAPVTPTYIDYYDATDEQGETNYQFPNRVVVQITANKGSFKACSFAEVDEGSNSVQVDLKPYGDEENGCDTN